MKRTIYTGKWKRFGKRALAAALVFAMLAQGAAPLQAKEAEGYVTLPAAAMPEEIQEADTFYVGTTSADLEENAKMPYLLQIGRGGSAEKAASVVLKISDATAGYGKDYKIRLHEDGTFLGGKTEADSPEDNKSLLDIISENEVIEDLSLTEEEQEAAEQENLESLAQGASEYSEAVQDNGQEKNKKANNPLAQAKETLTGAASDRENVTSTQRSMVDVLSDTGNYLTQLVPGATLRVDFAAGEKTKYVEIETIDNEVSDGGRSFYVTLSEPSEGMTNSSVSESIFTIQDDEPQEDAVVSFAAAEFTAEAGLDSVEVVLTRTGAMTQMVSVHMASEAGSAVSGQDFAPVNADVVFPFGITERKLKIAVDSRYLTQDADFTLQISDGNGAKAGEGSQARVVIRPEAKAAAASQKAGEGKTGKTEEVSAQASLSDKKYGDNINLHDAAWYVRCGGDGNTSWGVNNDGPKGRIYSIVDDSWQDIAIALSGNNGRTKHTTKIKFLGKEQNITYYTFSATRQYVYDGFRFKWRKYSGKSSWSSADVAYYRANETSNAKIFYSTGDKPRFDWEEREYYFGNTDAAAVKFYNYNWKGKQNTLDIDWIKPILRPFKVELSPADKLTYYNGSGDTKVENANAVASTLLDSSGGYAVKYDGDKMVISQNNALLGISRLAGVEIVSTYPGRSGSKRIDSRFLNGFKKGDSKIQVSLNNDFCTEYAWYIGYEGNGNSSMRGKIKLKPVYEYINSMLTVNRNTERTASGGTVDCKVQINGKEVSYGQALTYHMGDRLSLASYISGGDYAATGMELSFKNNKTGRNEVNQYGYNQGRYVMDVSRESYTAVPMFTENDNRIVVCVSENDVKNFKASGIFDASYLNQYGTKSGGYYSIEVVGTAQMKDMAGASFTLAAEAKDGYIPIWQETNSSKYFMGTTFEYTAKTRRTANIVSLYASKASANYGAVKGSVYYENLALNNPTAAGEAILPADGGYLSAAGQFAVADVNGAVQTPAFLLPDTITKDGKAVRIDKPYVRALAGAAGATQYKDICLRTSGNTVSVADAAGTARKAHLTDLSAMTISSNTGENTRFSGVYIKNRNFPTDTAYMNDESTSISVNVTEINGEKVKSVNFLVYDRHTNEIKHTIAAGKSGSTWTGMYTFKSDGSEDTLYAEGDRIYVQMTTDKKAQVLKNVDDKGKPVVSDSELNQAAKNSLNQTTYAPVNTGYTLVKSGLYEEPTTQSLDIGSLKGLSGIPLVNNFNTNLNLGPLNLTVENLYDDQQNVCGTRLKAAIGLDFEKTRFASDNYMVKDDGMNYGVSAMTLLKDFGKVKDGFKAAADNIAGAKNLGKTSLASMGAQKWGVYPSVGFYLDFAVAYNKDDAGTVSDSRFVLQGGGIYLGASANYSVAWYALIPVVYIPCYFGVAGNLSLSLQAGATTTVKHTEEPVTVEDFTGTSHNLSETLDFDFKFSAAGQVQVYCGVGICGTLGVRGGLQVDAGFTWYPTLHKHNPYFDQVGFTLDVGFKMWVDLLVFTIPIPVYSIPTQNFGLNKQYEELKDKNEDDLNTIIGNKVKTAKADSPFPFEKQPEQEEAGITYLLKERDNDPSSWLGKMDQVSAESVATMAAYKEKNTHTLQADGYDRPDSQMIDMGGYGTLLVFLQDDKSRTDAERTAASYSVYKDGAYSDPVIIQKDGTADYQPSVTDAGDNILITWVSGDPSRDKGDVNDSAYQTGYLKSQEVYMVSVPKADLAAHKEIVQKDITKLTDDEYYDSDPVALYDKSSGDINVYYVKTAEDNGITDVEAADLANPMNTSGKTYSVIAYRVYDASQGKWAVEDYEEKEKPDNVTDAEYKAQLLELGGQRMLSSPIQSEDVDMEDPLISDFTAIGYNGAAVFAYTVDKGYSADTDTDRDLFLQLYDFNTRSTYKPIRITDDNLADSMPQLIRRGGDEEGTTYLFWKSGDTLDYIDVTSLVKYGIDDNGSIRPEALEQPGDSDVGDGSEGSDEDIYAGMTPEEEARATYSFQIKEVDAYGADENQYASYSQYKAAVDADNNLYLIWVDNGDPEGKTSSQEIYAAAMIESEVAGSTEGEDSIKAWSAPNKLTNFGKYVDEPAFAITKEGRMLMSYNKYDITEDADGNPKPADMELASSMLEPYGSVEATVIALSDITPVAGQEVEVSVRFENTGLTVAKDGFEAEIYEKAADGAKKLIKTYKHEAGLIATGIVNETFLYTANEKTPGSVIEVSVTENNLEGRNVNSSEPFVEAAEYEIAQNNAYQGPDSKFYSEVVVTNTGNKPSAAGDELQVKFAGPYGNAASYGISQEILAKKAVSLPAGESETVRLELKVPAEAFRYYGKIDVEAQAVNKDGDIYNGALADTIHMSQPADLALNENKDVQMKAGETKDLSFQYGTCAQLLNVVPAYASDDESVVLIEDGKLVAVGEGSTVVTAYAYPYNTAASIQVTVKSDGSGTETPGETEQPVILAKAKIKGMASAAKKQLTVSWDKVDGADGYEVIYATNKAFTKNKGSKKTAKTSLTLKKLSENKTWYVKVRAYANQGGRTYTGTYSKVRYIKLSLRPAKVKKITVKAKARKLIVTAASVKGASGYEIAISTDRAGKKTAAVKKAAKGKASFMKLKKKKTYYVTVRSYKKTKDGGYLYSAKTVKRTKTL